MDTASGVLQRLRENISKVIVGKDRTMELLLSCFAAGGHALIEDVPGTGKTVLARSLAASAALHFSRIQFTPDLLPGDVTGLNYYDQSVSKFVFRPGPVFTHILLADEINRATPRTQSALLECMAEGQVTIDGQTRPLEDPFFVIATQNPVETLGTFPLPEAQMDRFLMQISMGTLSREEELRMIDRFIDATPLENLAACCSREEILALRRTCRKVYVHPDLRDYIVRLVQHTRTAEHSALSVSGSASAQHRGASASMQGDSSAARIPRIEDGVSPRGTLALVRASQGFALMQGRDFVVPEDIRSVAVSALAHRLLSSEVTSWREKEDRILSALTQTEVPTEDWSRRVL